VKDEVYIPSVPVVLNKLKDRIRKATAKTDQLLLLNAWHNVEYHLDVRRATNGAGTELAEGTKRKLTELLFTMACV
jgi:hypothetical protein